MWPSGVKLVSSFASFFLRTFHKTNGVFSSFPRLDTSQASSTPFCSFPVFCWPVKHYYSFGSFFFSEEKFLPDYSHCPNLACPVSYLHYSFSHQLLVSSHQAMCWPDESPWILPLVLSSLCSETFRMAPCLSASESKASLALTGSFSNCLPSGNYFSNQVWLSVSWFPVPFVQSLRTKTV